jgi:ATP-dependent Lhr-like helicase
MLERLHRRSLAAARRAVRPVEPSRYADFLLRWHHLTPATRQEAAPSLDRALEALAGFQVPGELFERELLARRSRVYDPAVLDRRISDGEWLFRASLTGNARAPRVAFWPRAELRPPELPEVDPETAEGRVLSHLGTRGASFFSDLWTATELDASALADALWQLTGAGLVTNDRFEVIRRGRAGVGPEQLASYRAARGSRVTPRFQSGRWSLVGTPPTDAEWWAARLLDRYGIVAREHVLAERPPVAWKELLDVWKRLELGGEVRRGHFVDGFGGAQFAWPAAVELLRAEAPPATVALSVCDPACAWGVLLPVPLAAGLADGGSVARLPSNFLVVDHGAPSLVLETAARRLRVTGSREPQVLARAVAALATVGGVLEIEEVDGVPVGDTPLSEALRGAGFEPDGSRLRRSPLRVRPLQVS